MISEKVQQLKQDFDNIYGKGASDGWESGYEQGQDNVENLVTYNRQRTRYGNAFAYQDWSGYTFNPPLVVKDTINNMFFTYQGTELPQGIDCSQATGLPDTMFRYSQKLEHIYDVKLPAPTKYYYTFGDMKALKKIDIVRCNADTTFESPFRQVATLEEVTFSGVIGQNGLNLQWATNLKRESLLSILNCLQDKSSDTSATWKVTIGSTNLAKLTTEEIENAQKKGWQII